MTNRPRGWLGRGLRWLGLAALLAIGLAVADAWRAFGRRADGARLARMEASPQWKDGHFENPQPLANDAWGSITAAFHPSSHTSPDQPIATVAVDRHKLAKPPQSGLRVTWLGHSTQLIEIDGSAVLTDPVWSERASPLRWIGPRRWYAPPIELADLPHIDAVLISHDHYDHLDYRTITAIKDWNTTFIVPLGVGAHLAYWGVPEGRIVELDWWQQHRVGNLRVVSTPARHASGRIPPIDYGATLWAGYGLVGEAHRVFFSGDTGLYPAMKEIGDRLGPFDLTMIEIGQYHRAWPDWHIGPEQAVTAHRLLRGRVMLPVHWGLFMLAFHGWTEPAERVLAARAGTVIVATPRPGESFEPAGVVPAARWWPALPWQTSAQAPIVSTMNP
jgi:L-ascorbate metabolism protein UlaG (beta-lactamase superfamily)